jgi:hypothetical protein
MNNLLLTNGQYKVEIIDETDFSKNFIDIPEKPSIRHALNENFAPTCWYRVTCQSNDLQKACYVLSDGSPTSVNEHSGLLSKDALLLAIGYRVCKLQLPGLELIWNTRTDTSACFGLYFSPLQDGLLVHGECEITRLELNGKIDWQVSGKDIFSEDFQIFPSHIETVDFSHEKYRIDIATGNIALINN